jgi:hydroxylaminobenzene mutase
MEDTLQNKTQSDLSRKLIRSGVLLFLFGLLTGFVIPVMQNSRMGLSSHLEGIQNGMLLMIIGVIWNRLYLSEQGLKRVYFLALFGTFTNWATTFLAGLWGAGEEMMPIAGAGFNGAVWQEILIKGGLFSLAITMVIVSVMLLIGLRGRNEEG